jgi:AraC-like DNA-binding protein
MNTWTATLRLPIWRPNVDYRRVVLCALSRSPLECRFVATCFTEEFEPALLHSDKSLLAVALEVGFSDQPAFNRSFHEIVGTSPGQWRRANAPTPKSFILPSKD